MPRSHSKAHRTQFFSTLLESLMERNGINQVQMGVATGIAVSRINNYLHGKYRTIRPNHLGKIAAAASRTTTERGELARAYVMDLLPEELKGDLSLEVADAAGKATRAPRPEKNGLPGTAAAAMNKLLTLSMRSPKARYRMQQFAEILLEAHRA
jgi:transcriptional regulator with XRE-family HTH domain